MAIGVYLNFNGNATEALDFYQSIFGGKVYKMTFDEMPPDENFVIPDDKKDHIMHASITVGDTSINMSDILPGMGPDLVVGNNVQVMFSTDDYDQAKRIYDALIDKGQVIMPFSETFWSKGYGLLVDRFGIQWHIDVE